MSDLFIGNLDIVTSSTPKINISTATLTLDSTPLVYDGTLKTQNVTVTIGGQTLTQGTDYTVINNAYTNAGDYTLSVMGIGNYKSTITANWSIAKATGSVSVNPSSLSILGVNGTATSIVTVVGDGVVNVSTSDDSIATASISGDTVTMTSVAGGNATITVTLGAGTNYTSNSATISVSVMMISPTLSNNTPELIQAAAQAGIASTLWSVGAKTGAINIGAFSGIAATTNVSAFIIGFNHNSSKEGNGIYFQFGKIGDTDVAFYSLKMNNSNTSSGGWNGSNMRTTHCSAFLSALPQSWQNVIASTSKYTDNQGGSGKNVAQTVTNDKIWLLSEYEVFGSNTYAASTESSAQAQYDYYKNGNSKIKYQHNSISSSCWWWLRSPYCLSVDYFCHVYSTNSSSYINAAYSCGFAPGFRIA